MRVQDLIGAELDYWVARALGDDHATADFKVPAFSPSTEWAHGGPLIEREKIDVRHVRATGEWLAQGRSKDGFHSEPIWLAETPLIAACRAFVASKFGDTVPGESTPPVPPRTFCSEEE